MVKDSAFAWVPPFAQGLVSAGRSKGRHRLRRAVSRAGRQNVEELSRPAAIRAGARLRKRRTQAIRVRRHRDAHRNLFDGSQFRVL
jgi:hypothetical protein